MDPHMMTNLNSSGLISISLLHTRVMPMNGTLIGFKSDQNNEHYHNINSNMKSIYFINHNEVLLNGCKVVQVRIF